MYSHQQDSKSLPHPRQRPRTLALASNPISTISSLSASGCRRGQADPRLISSRVPLPLCASLAVCWTAPKPERQPFTEEGTVTWGGHFRSLRHVLKTHWQGSKKDNSSWNFLPLHRMLYLAIFNQRTSLSGDEKNVGSHHRRKLHQCNKRERAPGRVIHSAVTAQVAAWRPDAVS